MRLKTLFYAIIIFAIGTSVLFFTLRGYMLQIAYEKVQQRLQNKYGLILTSENFAFIGFFKVEAHKIALYQPQSPDTLATIEEIACDISFLDIVRGRLNFDYFSIANAQIKIVDSLSNKNYSLPQEKHVNNGMLEEKPQKGYATIYETIQEECFKILGTGFELSNIAFLYYSEHESIHIQIQQARYNYKSLNTTFYNISEAGTDTFKLGCQILENRKRMAIELRDVSQTRHFLPFFSTDSNLCIKIENIKGNINLSDNTDHLIHFNADAECRNLIINHYRLSPTDVVINNAGFDFSFTIGDNTIQIDSSSKLILNKIYTSCYARYSNPDKRITLRTSIPSMPSNDFFDGLPQNMFSTLKGIKTTGLLSYNMYFDCALTNPDSLTFESELKGENFKITKFGVENFSRINADFTYNALDGDRLIKQIAVSSINPNFVALENIDTNLIHAVLTSEDGSFFYHKGFNEEAFRQSIAANIREQRFVRGGSTITMQLVKNCFLSRNKTISRKMEEALIVWIMENSYLVSKKRILEVYFNIIEWGPGVYGIGEATAFYFNKTPKTLTLEECIFLASLVPHPKYYKYSFDRNGVIKPYMQSFYDLLKRKMLMRAWLLPADTVAKQYEIKLTGPAAAFITPADSAAVDSIPSEMLDILQ